MEWTDLAQDRACPPKDFYDAQYKHCATWDSFIYYNNQ